MTSSRASITFVALLSTAALTLAACGGGDSDPGQAQEFCDQLAAGTAPFDIFQSMSDDYSNQPDWAAAAKGWATSTCPDQLASNDQLRNIIFNTGGDPDS